MGGDKEPAKDKKGGKEEKKKEVKEKIVKKDKIQLPKNEGGVDGKSE